MGNVAENNRICLSAGRKLMTCSISGWNSGLSSLSASSITNSPQLERFATPLFAKSKTLSMWNLYTRSCLNNTHRPGVATRMWTGLYKRMMSSFKLVPPVVTMTSTFKCFPSSLVTWEVCRASSRVGTSTSTWRVFLAGSTFSKQGITKAAVFPVPFFARARISLTQRQGDKALKHGGLRTPSSESDGDGLFLNGARFLIPLLEDSHEQFPFEVEILERVPLGAGNVFGLLTFIFFGHCGWRMRKVYVCMA